MNSHLTKANDGRHKLIPLGIFVLSWVFLTTSYQTTFAFDHPIYSAIWACVLAATILLFHSVFDRIRTSCSLNPFVAAVAQDLETFRSLFLPSPTSRITWSWIAKRGRNIFTIVACVLCIRIELFRQLTVHYECAPTGYAYAIPFLISLYDYFSNPRHQAVEGLLPIAEQRASSRFDVLRISYRRVGYYLLESRERYLVSTALFAFAGLLAPSFQKGQASTYICSIVSGQNWRIPLFSIVSVVLDTVLLIRATDIYSMWLQAPEQQRRVVTRQWGNLLLGVALFWTLFACIISLFGAQGGITFRIRGYYVQSALGQSCLVVVLSLSALQLLPRYGILMLSMIAGFVALYLASVAAIFHGRQQFPFINPCDAITFFITMFAGAVLFLYAWSASEEGTKQLPKPPSIIARLSFTLMLSVGLIVAVLQANITSGHPIDLLIAKGEEQHNIFLVQAHASNTLEEAVAEYQRRYKIPPPPGFDKWYEYASSRASPIIDDFDQIYSDLLPFRVFSPQQLREFTHQMATNPANNIGAVSIRNGTSIPQQNIWASHAWMVSAIATMIRPFSNNLPDMDIAFNLDDQPRVAVPWETVSAIRDAAQSQAHQDLVLNTWSKDRSSGWGPLQPVDQTRTTSFSNNDGLRIFDKYVRDLCPPSSKTRTSRIWDRYRICLSCVRPHSIGQFPSDWNLANDICHQPDLAELHGVFSGPTGFVVSRELLPVFSQSSIAGFSDILYPSPWNYVDNVKYEPSEAYPDPDYDEKENTLFWIGSTSEGMGSKGRWKGLGRQRFTHLVNNNTESQVSILLPTNGPNNYTYQILDGSAPTRDLGLHTNVHVTEPIKHCGQCDTQKKELGTAARVNFQSSWQYRYLFDLDGAGFSGRFLPFLQSRSLLFKAGIFRQWFDSRITPWLHFVPVDLRLHGMWSTLAYFAGVNGTVSGTQGGIFGLFAKSRRVEMHGHYTEGRQVAEEGRKWAERAVRKEDMEIYFFRLLLEWGRLTDDHRDVLGFKLE